MVGKPGIYLDTSGVLAFFDASDVHHESACRAWESISAMQSEIILTDYVRLECWSLLQRRLGMEAAEDFLGKILPICRFEPVGEKGFELLSRQAILSQRRKLSLVDFSSFDCMHRLGIKRAVAFDRHFDEQGFITPNSAEW